MKKLCLLVLLVAGFAITASSQTITNNTQCPINVRFTCLNQATCTGNALPPFTTINPGQTILIPACPGGLPFTVIHLWFGNGCNTNDPFIGVPGNCKGLPTTAVMTSKCDACPTGTINYTGGGNWVIN